MVLCAVFPTALPLPACKNPGSPTPKTTISGVATFPPGTRASPSQKGEDPRVPWSQVGVGSPFIQGSRGAPLWADSKNWRTTTLTSQVFLHSLSHSAALKERPTVFFGSSSWWSFPCTDLFHRQLIIFSLGLDDLFLQPPMCFSQQSILF